MVLTELYQLLKTLKIPIAYHHFEEGHSPTPPYVVYLITDSENFGADNWAYQKQEVVTIELYTSKKDLIAEQKVESLLDSAFFYFDKVESYLTSEKLYQIIYTIRLLGG